MRPGTHESTPHLPSPASSMQPTRIDPRAPRPCSLPRTQPLIDLAWLHNKVMTFTDGVDEVEAGAMGDCGRPWGQEGWGVVVVAGGGGRGGWRGAGPLMGTPLEGRRRSGGATGPNHIELQNHLVLVETEIRWCWWRQELEQHGAHQPSFEPWRRAHAHIELAPNGTPGGHVRVPIKFDIVPANPENPGT